jgi:SAM-dependent methyltransferase
MDAVLEATARAENDHFWFRGLRRHAAAMLDAATDGRRDLRILDCGAGTGRNLDWLATRGRAVGIEYSETGLQVARAHGRRIVQGTVTKLPFAGASFDVATSFDVLYCLDDDDEQRAVREMWRVLVPGGVAIVNVAALDILHGGHSTLGQERRRYTPDRLRQVLEPAGFRIERITFTNMPTFPITLAMRLFDRMTGRAARGTVDDLAVPPWPVNAAFDLALRAEHALLSLTDLPIGTSLMCVARKAGTAGSGGVAAQG